jgi:hypothetical protein
MSKRSIVHIEIPAKSTQSTGKFYSELFGWEVEHTTEPVPYSMFSAGSNLGGGFPELGDMYKPGDVIVYVESEDIEADLKRIAELGGQPLGEKVEIPGMGWLAFFNDPTGNRLALWKSANSQAQ